MLTSSLMDAQTKVEDTVEKLRVAQAESNQAKNERNQLNEQLEELQTNNGSAQDSSAVVRDLQKTLKKVQAEHLQQQNVNKAMSNKIMRLEKEATDERRRRVELESQLSNMGVKSATATKG